MSEDRVTTSVTKVIVYPDRARVTRQGKISLETGIHSLVVEGLPGSLEPDSVRASGRGSTQAKLLSVRTARAFLTAAPREQVAQLEKRIEVLADRDQGLADKEKSLDAQITFLSSLADSTAQELGRGIALGRADVSTAQSMALYTRDSMNQACDELRKIQVQRRDMQR